MEALIFSLLCLCIFGSYDFFIARPARRINTILLATLLALGQFLVFTCLFIFFAEDIEISWKIAYPLLSGLGAFLGIIFYSKSLQTGFAGISASIANAYPLVTIFVATLFLGETITAEQFLFFVLIIGGIFFLSFHINEIKSLKFSQCKRSFLYAFGAMLMWAMFVTFFDRSVEYFSATTTIFIAEAGNIIWGIIALIIAKEKIIEGIKKIDMYLWRDMVTVLVCSLFGIFFFAKAFEMGSLSFVSAITACSPAVTTILARIFLQEKLSSLQYISIFLLIFGISGLSYVSL